MATRPILLLEDAEIDEMLFRRVMTRAAVRNPIFVARTGAAAIQWLSGKGPYADREKYPMPTVLFVDLNVPQTNGFEVLTWMQAQPQLEYILRIVLTGMDHLDKVHEAYHLGAHSFLTKPMNVGDVLNLFHHFRGPWDFQETPPPA